LTALRGPGRLACGFHRLLIERTGNRRLREIRAEQLREVKARYTPEVTVPPSLSPSNPLILEAR